MNLFPSEATLLPLRGRQPQAIEGIKQAIREGHKRIMLQLPTGGGKTVLSSHLITGALAKGNRVMFCVPRLSLIDQTVERFVQNGIRDIGVIQGQHRLTNPYACVQVASIQTLVRREIPDVTFIILDEAHIQRKEINALLQSEEWKDKIVIGLSATPWSKGLGLIWTRLIIGATTRDMIEEGWLSPLRGFSVPDEFMPDTSKIHTNFDGDYVEGEAEKEMSKDVIVGNVVDTWLKHRDLGNHPGDRTFMFCVNRTHAQKMQQAFEKKGIPCGYIDGTMDADEREEVFKRYRAREIKIISSIDTIGIGVDEDVRCIVYTRLTRSEMKWVQDIGRGLRLADGKLSVLLLDHAGTCEELGDPTYIHHDRLDTRSPKEKGAAYQEDVPPPKPRKCPKCSYLISAGALVCPECGTLLAKKSKTPREVQGELVEIGKKPKKANMDDKQKFYSELLGYAMQYGKSEKWVLANYRQKFGVWPRSMQEIPLRPSTKFRTEMRDKFNQWKKEKEGVA